MNGNWPVHPAAELFPMLNKEELQGLADNIRQHGLHEPLWLWEDPKRGTVLLDGRNRLAACELAGIQPATRMYEGSDPVMFVISENVKRRHLTAMQKAGVAVKALPLLEKQNRDREAKRKKTPPHRKASKKTEAVLPQSSEKVINVARAKAKRAPQSRDDAARVVGTSGRSVAQYKRIAEQAKDLLPKIDSGELSGERAERIIRDRQAQHRRVEQAKREAEAQPQPTLVDIRHGDFRNVLADLHDIDAIITDPPYPAEFLPLLDDLAGWADKALKPNGVLAILMGQTHLPEVFRRLNGHRPYRWTGCYLTTGPAYVSHKARIQSQWKPLIVYGGGPRFSDLFRSEGSDADAKSNHKWGQDYNAFHTIVERLTSRRQTVVDPFMGPGTTLLAAYALGRHAIGCDIDADHVKTAKARLA